MPALSCASTVEAPRCGVTTTLSKPNSGLSVHGSVTNTSSPAPATRPSLSASASACSSTRPPRAALMMRTSGLHSASSRAPISPVVSGVLGRWIEMKSLSRSSSSRSTSVTPSCAARAGWTYGSYASSRVPNAAIRWAKSTPMRPSPTTPTVLSATSTPVQRLRSHRPALRALLAAAVWRAVASSSVTACSAALTTLDSGALTTRTPRAVAAGTSTLSRPIPARATTCSFGAALSASSSTCVALRTTIAAASSRAASSAGRSVPSTSRTSTSSPSAATTDGASSSASRTIGRGVAEVTPRTLASALLRNFAVT